MDDDDLFERSMRSLGVRPLKKKGSGKKVSPLLESPPEFSRGDNVSPRRDDGWGGDDGGDGEDAMFLAAMRSLDVAPKTPKPAAKSPTTAAEGVPSGRNSSAPVEPPRSLDDTDEEIAVFHRAMEDLVAPDKDRAAAKSAPQDPRISRVKAAKSRGVEPDATLDLHGYKSDEAVEHLERFVAEGLRHRFSTLLVVTGKGLRSESGHGVLRGVVEHWLRQKGKRSVRAFSVAPRELGGRGAYVLYLRPRNRPR